MINLLKKNILNNWKENTFYKGFFSKNKFSVNFQMRFVQTSGLPRQKGQLHMKEEILDYNNRFMLRRGAQRFNYVVGAITHQNHLILLSPKTAVKILQGLCVRSLILNIIHTKIICYSRWSFILLGKNDITCIDSYTFKFCNGLVSFHF